MILHIFDINTLISTDSCVWIIHKYNPNTPIVRIPKVEFNLINKGVYKKFNNLLKIGNKEYWLSDVMMEDLKVKSKVVDITELSISMREFMEKEYVKDVSINLYNTNHIKSDDVIHVICSKNTESNYVNIIPKLEGELAKKGLKVEKYHYITETFYNRDSSDIATKKMRLALQYQVGYKTEGDKFIEDELPNYDVILYDDNIDTLGYFSEVNDYLNKLYNNTEEYMQDWIKKAVKKNNEICFYKTAFNKMNPFEKMCITLSIDNIIKRFENFN